MENLHTLFYTLIVSEQGEQLKKTAKDIENYINQTSQIISKLGNDKLFQSVRNDLNKFKQQLQEEKMVLELAGQILIDVVQSYTGTEKKSVQKVSKIKAHNRDFYKRPVVVAAAGSASGAAAGASAAAASSSSASATVTINSAPAAAAAPVSTASAATPASVSVTENYSETNVTNVFVMDDTSEVPQAETTMDLSSTFDPADIAAATAGVGAGAGLGAGAIAGVVAAGVAAGAVGGVVSGVVKNSLNKKDDEDGESDTDEE